MAKSLVPTIGRATLIAGTLDLLSAFAFSAMKDVGPVKVLQGVASGAWGDAMRDGGAGAAILGLATHFAIMALMASVFVIAASKISWLRRNALLAGIGYGLILYGVMYRIVLVMRYPDIFPRNGLWDVSNALFSHIACVGVPIALIAARRLRGFTIR